MGGLLVPPIFYDYLCIQNQGKEAIQSVMKVPPLFLFLGKYYRKKI